MPKLPSTKELLESLEEEKVKLKKDYKQLIKDNEAIRNIKGKLNIVGNKTALPLMEDVLKKSNENFDTSVDESKQKLKAKIKQLTARQKSFFVLPSTKKDAKEKIELINQELKSLECFHESYKFQEQRIKAIAEPQERQHVQEAGSQKVTPSLLKQVNQILEGAGIEDTKSQDKTPPTTPNSPQQNTSRGRS